MHAVRSTCLLEEVAPARSYRSSSRVAAASSRPLSNLRVAPSRRHLATSTPHARDDALRRARDDAAVRDATGGLTLSGGLGPNFRLAKVAADQKKPDGQFRVGAGKTAVLEFLRFLTEACVGIFQGHPPPPRPVNIVAILMGTFASVVPAFDLLIRLQKAKDRRQGAKPPEGVTVYPDQTVLCDFVCWGIACAAPPR